MKLLREFADVKIVKEDTGGQSTYNIKGIFMQAERENRNGRIYPVRVLKNQVDKYQDMIREKRSLGELGHPENPSLNLERVSHLITNLKMEGTNVVGVAKVLDTPYGKITKNLLDEGVKLGVSSRGLGSLQEKNGKRYVGDDFQLSTVDIVHEPSAHEAFVEAMIEGTDWVMDQKGNWVPAYREQALKKVASTT
jgi:hypothetical protein